MKRSRIQRSSGQASASHGAALTSVCLACRTALPRDTVCDGGRNHQVVDLQKRRGRSAHLRAVWGGPARQSRLRELVRSGATGSGAGALAHFFDCSGARGAGSLGALATAVAIGAFVFIGLFYVGRMIGQALQRRRELRPYGVVERTALPAAGEPRYGVAEGVPQASPLGRQPCLAFDIVLRTTQPAAQGCDVLWREASTTGFTIRLDDGTTVRVPAGRVRFAGKPVGRYHVLRDDVVARLPGGIGVDVEGDLSHLPFDEAFEEIIRPMDRVAILSRTEPREDTEVPRASLRDPAAVVLVAMDTPVIARAS